MYKSFITTIAAAAVAVTSVNVTPADAGDRDKLAKYLTGAAALIIIGSALNNQNSRPSSGNHIQVHQPHKPQHGAHGRPHQGGYKTKPHRGGGHKVHKPHRGAKAKLPTRCLRHVPRRNGDTYRTIAARCLNKHYSGARNLPRVCRESVKMNGKWRATYKLRCLRDKGYRIAWR